LTLAVDVNSLFKVLYLQDNSGLPKHQRLTNALVDAIEKGVWGPGDKLPSEEEIVSMTPYSLGTVQRALRNLSEQGVIVKQHGLGNFVADSSHKVHEPWHCRFLGDDGKSFLPLYTHALRRVALSEPGHWTPYLGEAAAVMRLDRIIDVNHEFNIYGRFYADRQVLKNLWQMPMEQLNGMNLKDVIIRDFKLPITEIVHLVSYITFDDEVCEHLALPRETPGMLVQAVAYAGKLRCVYYQEFYVPRTPRVLSFPEANLGARA
jgi:GntR family transcriptional regulator